MKILTASFKTSKELQESVFEDDIELNEYLDRAYFYLSSQKWCKSINKGWLAKGWPGVLAICYFQINPDFGADEFVWVVVGDLPTAYIDIESATELGEVLSSYVVIMEDWVDAVESGKSLDDVFPVEVTPNKKFTSLLKKRLLFIKERIIPLSR